MMRRVGGFGLLSATTCDNVSRVPSKTRCSGVVPFSTKATGVEAGKRCAADVLALQTALLAHLEAGHEGDAAALAGHLGGDPTLAFHVLRHLAATGRVTVEGLGLDQRFGVGGGSRT